MQILGRWILRRGGTGDTKERAEFIFKPRLHALLQDPASMVENQDDIMLENLVIQVGCPLPPVDPSAAAQLGVQTAPVGHRAAAVPGHEVRAPSRPAVVPNGALVRR